MRRAILFTAAAFLLSAQPRPPQAETFDIATFHRPPNFVRNESNGILLLTSGRTRLGRSEFCEIYLIPSRATQSPAADNFQREWQTRVAAVFHLGQQPTPTPETTPDGWTTLTAKVDLATPRGPARLLLVNFTGFSQTTTVVVDVSANSYQPEVTAFFSSLHFHPAARTAPPAASGTPDTQRNTNPAPAAPGSLDIYSYATPDGWSRQASANGIVLASPVFPNGERCQINMLPTRAAGRSLPDDAIASFRNLFRADPLTTYPSPPPKLEHGASPLGWEYFSIRKLIGGQEGESRTSGAILLAVKSGDTLATIAATSKDFLVSRCFGELADNAWPRFFYSLDFKNAHPSADAAASLPRKLAGVWIAATGSVGLRYEFHADGRYLGAGAAMQRNRISPTEILQTTQAYFGDGAFAADGNHLILTGDDHSKRSFLFRVGQTSSDSGRTWIPGLCLLEGAASGEVCYRKQ